MGIQQPTGPSGPSEQMLMYRVEALERTVRELVPANVNELQLKSIRDAIDLLRQEIRESAIKNEAKQEALDAKVDKRISDLVKSLDQFKTWILTGAIAVILTLIGYFISAYALHLFGP